MSQPLLWDIFCRVIDNLGDIGVCWRLATDLSSRGQRVRLWVDAPDSLTWMAPGALQGKTGVEVCHWDVLEGAGTSQAPGAEGFAWPPCGDVVIEAFGCDLPERFIERMAERARDESRPAAVWLNLEYLSAQSYVERSHLLLSPQFSGPAAGLKKWFFYPGFTTRTGGLLREADLLSRQAQFDAQAWRRQTLGLTGRPGERWISLFSYPAAPLALLINTLAALEQPHTLLLAAGQGPAGVGSPHEDGHQVGNCRLHQLPLMSQREFDALLWACDINFVRGEDSFVRAQWAGKPMVWNIYPQDDGAHWDKLAAFEARCTAGAPAAWAMQWRRLQAIWNGAASTEKDEFSQLWAATVGPAWIEQAARWRSELLAQDDLSTQMLSVVENCRRDHSAHHTRA